MKPGDIVRVHPGQLRRWTDAEGEIFLVIGVRGRHRRRWSIMTRTGTHTWSEGVLIKHSEAFNEAR
jgi:hypothetical protein